jgi:hypothetical protein
VAASLLFLVTLGIVVLIWNEFSAAHRSL